METENDIVVDAIRNSCTLVTFGTHKWQPMKTDAKLAVEVKTGKSATGKAVSTKVNLANGFENLLSSVTRVMSRAYHAHIRMTVPWGEGQRLLPNLQLVEYMQEMQEHRAKGHADFRSWCEHCVAGSGRPVRHVHGEDASSTPEIALDFTLE